MNYSPRPAAGSSAGERQEPCCRVTSPPASPSPSRVRPARNLYYVVNSDLGQTEGRSTRFEGRRSHLATTSIETNDGNKIT